MDKEGGCGRMWWDASLADRHKASNDPSADGTMYSNLSLLCYQQVWQNNICPYVFYYVENIFLFVFFYFFKSSFSWSQQPSPDNKMKSSKDGGLVLLCWIELSLRGKCDLKTPHVALL